ncbi:histone deacetylase [Thermosyntropha sp.]|uniref:histone deacetylase family protein n=1 Tax=Thermosyntropha sp. TaxID=2740820 RepID=UPI0025D2923A|nr:histone deacetylase [Thermosyntropha sp.]MBO8158379.1 histone deacetylase [Thermosyntropha sp.]
MKPTGILFFPAFDWAISPTHPEREERLLYTRDQLFEEGILDLPQIKEYKPALALFKDIARVHFCVPDIEKSITEAHLIAAGSAIKLADAFMQGEIKNGFAIIRPPGHHSMTVSHGNRGFCNINNEAIMIEYLRKKYRLKKIAVIDTDVHHGDGTQEIYYNDPDVLFISFHQDGRTLYPGTGFTNELGNGRGYGATINIPLLPRTTDEEIHYVLDNLVLPVLNDFKPDLIVNSAGQDNHYTDPLADMCFTAQGYALLNHKLKPDVAVLEGGYSVETALPYINMGIIMAMAGLDFSNLREPDYNPQRFRESSSHLEYLKRLVEKQLSVYQKRNETVAEQYEKAGEKFYVEEKSIFYDTEYIYESQINKLRLCPNCPGYRLIDSKARHRDGKSYHIYCVSIPVNCCDSCHSEALRAYKDISVSSFYDIVYLQDRINDEYISLNKNSGIEKVL